MTWLQWGRGLEPAETVSTTSGSIGRRSFNGAAGLNPRRHAAAAVLEELGVEVLQWGRGLEPAETSVRGRRSHACAKLQWGRGLEPAETVPSRTVGAEAVTLQWGRGLEPAETPRRTRSRARGRSSFNGAAGLNPRRHRQRTLPHAGVPRFNGAAGLNPRRLPGCADARKAG